MSVPPRVEPGTHPRISGHRGSLDTDPENTIRSFRRAIADGADTVELDLHVSTDGELVVMHDATVDRTTNGSGRINDLDLESLRRLRVDGEPVPTFSEVLDAINMPIQVEVKDPLAVEPLLRLLRDQSDIGTRIVLSGFSDEIIQQFADGAPEVPRGLITHGFDASLPARATALGCSVVYSGWHGLTKHAVEEIHRAGMSAVVWLVNSRQQLSEALELGVDEFSTNHPAKLAGWLRT